MGLGAVQQEETGKNGDNGEEKRKARKGSCCDRSKESKGQAWAHAGASLPDFGGLLKPLIPTLII